MLNKITLLFSLFTFNIYAQNVTVNFYNGSNISNLELLPANNNFTLIIDGETQQQSIINNIYNITADEDSLLISLELLPIKKAKKISFIADNDCTFKIKSATPALTQHIAEQEIILQPKNCFIQVINNLALDNYVAGVVEAEVGARQQLEYYKVQSTICRTYVLGHLRKHEKDGFNMCDKEHCQVFKGKSLANLDIITAVEQTSNSVLEDDNLNLIVAAFHSNCGGQTVSSAEVWNKAQSYFVPTRDTFCINSRNAHWEKEISKKVWFKYLKKKFPQNDSLDFPKTYNFLQPTRKKDFEVKLIKIPLKDLRTDFNLKSTYFSVEDAGDVLILKGKGFGHGIGLCQEGAIRMAKIGYSYADIIHFYYRNVSIIDLRSLYFFKEVE